MTASPSGDVELAPDVQRPYPLRAACRDVSLPCRAARSRLRGRAARWLVLACAIGAAVPVHAARMLVLQSAETPRLAVTLAAMRERAGMQVDVVRLAAAASGEAWEAAVGRAERPGVVIALGPRASDFVARLAVPMPVVHCLAGADALRAGLPALPSEVPADTQAAWLRRLVPGAKTVGLAYEPVANTRRAEATAAALGAAGYRTWMSAVASPAALPAALDQIAARADVLLALPDATVYTRESARGILLHSFRRRMPLVGPNDAWVRMGALFAVDWDYSEVGALCAQLALRELHGAKPASPPPAPPRPRVSVNVRSAAQFGLTWDADLLRAVDQRHE